MTTIKDMLQAIINGQRALKEELLGEVGKVDGKISKVYAELESFREETKNNFKEVHERLDKQGKQLAYLEDDAPTREEHEALKHRFTKVEKILKITH